MGYTKIYIDVTETFESKLSTGIQRVVRKLSDEIVSLEHEFNVQVFPVISTGANRKKCQTINLNELTPVATKSLPEKSEELRTLRTLSDLWRFGEKVVGSRIMNNRLNLAIADKVSYFLRSRIDQRHEKANFIKFTSGDILLILDAFWGNDSGLEIAKDAKKSGAFVATLLNDVFPISHPELCDDNNVRRFTKMAKEALQLADIVLYPSEVTRIEIEQHIPGALQGKRHALVDYGHDGIQSSQSATEINFVREPNSILMLGTIEPRKNHSLVFRWFRESRSANTKLTIIGKAGWLTESLQKEMREERLRNEKFNWFENAPDSVVDEEMKKHQIGIMASSAEGFGLPIVELSRAGMNLVLSDIPIFREVAGSNAEYFNPNSVESLDAAITRAKALPIIRRIPLKTWNGTARQIVSLVTKL